MSGVAGVAAADKGGAGEGPDRFIVGTETDRGVRAAKQRAADEAKVMDFDSIGFAVAAAFSAEAIDALGSHRDVRYIERDGVVEAIGESLPWGIDRIDAEVAHDNGATGTGADIAILDTGIDSDHPDLQANIGTGYAVEICSGTGCNYAWDDDNDHGTHCGGIADAVDDSEGVIGVSTGATLHAVKVLDSNGSGTFSGVAEGLQWVADQGYDVGSMSFGASSGSQTIKDACQYAVDNGVLLVGAAGNDGPCTDCVGYPAAYSTVIAVSATESDDGIASFSSTGSEVEVAAPGVSIHSSVVGGYDTFSGTSMACPHVSGTAGQLIADGYSNTQARSQLQDSAEDVGLSSNEQGHGLVDTAAALGFDSSSGVAATTDAPTDAGDTSATLNGTLTDLGTASSADCHFEIYDTANDLWTATSAQTLSSTGSFSHTVSWLDKNVTYEYRAVVEGTDGSTDEGSLVSFTTGASLLISTGTVTNLTATSATLNGSLDDLDGAASADCYFDWRAAGTSTWTATSAQTLSSTGSFSQNVSGLEDGVDYEFRAVADASDGDSATGTTTTFTTTDDPPVVATGTPSSVSATTATFEGNLDDLGGANSADCAFDYRQSDASSWTSTDVQTLTSTGSFSHSVSGLEDGVDHEVQATVDASDDDSDTGSTVTFTTTDDPPGVTTESASSITDSSVTLAGTLDDLGNADAADCAFEYRQSGASSWNTTGAQTRSSTGSYSQDVSGLSSGSDYEYRAVTDASDGDTATGSSATFTTESGDTAVVVSTASSSSVGETSATLNGSLDDLGGAASADCAFEYHQSGASSWNTTSAQTLSSTGSYSLSVSGLSSGTDYEYRAVTDASDGDTDTGTSTSFTTSSSSSSTAPTIDRYMLSEAGSPNPHAEITADWTVSDADGDLSSVLVEVFDSSGTLVDSARSNVSGGSGSGTDKFKIKHAGKATYDVTVTVTDSDGSTATRTEPVSS